MKIRNLVMIIGLAAMLAVLLLSSVPAMAANSGGPPEGAGSGVETPYGPPGDSGPSEGNAHPGWGGSEGNKGPHNP
jgi:hypothetical protein